MIYHITLLVIACLVGGMTCSYQTDRSFVVDNVTNSFLKDGKPFRYVSAGIHYFRVREEDWEDRFYKIRKSGCNAIQFVIPWNVHETYEGKYVNLEKLVKFIKLAQAHDLLVLVRPGPYTCAEWEFGGFPYWLQKYKSIKIRTSDVNYMQKVKNWMSVLLPVLFPLLYSNGGPIIMVQVENEYGSYGCDHQYMSDLEELFKSHLGDKVIYYTVDGTGDSYLKCGSLPSLFSTIDFGAGGDPAKNFQVQRKYQPYGPSVNSEYYPGWLDHWGEPHQRRDADVIGKYLEEILALNASVNMYMFEGGTSFGFMNGANQGGVNQYQPQPTSYDYDSPLSEAGDPRIKYFIIQYAISKYMKIPDGPQPEPSVKAAYGKFFTEQIIDFYKLLETASPVENDSPLSFETLNAPYGYVLYRTAIPTQFQYVNNKLNVTLVKYHDRASFFVDKEFQGILTINRPINSMDVNPGTILDILVENQGRVNYGSYMTDTEKGLLDDVLINGVKQVNWKMYHVDGEERILNSTQLSTRNKVFPYTNTKSLPFIANFTFHVDHLADTFLKLDTWSKGFVNINGFNLGRYWTPVGPQKTLYVPSNLLSANQENYLIVFETDKTPTEVYIEFVDQPILG